MENISEIQLKLNKYVTSRFDIYSEFTYDDFPVKYEFMYNKFKQDGGVILKLPLTNSFYGIYDNQPFVCAIDTMFGDFTFDEVNLSYTQIRELMLTKLN